ncbi:MAG: hypothetical protein ABI175_09590, partial [Polyangiales bacterium]
MSVARPLAAVVAFVPLVALSPFSCAPAGPPGSRSATSPSSSTFAGGSASGASVGASALATPRARLAMIASDRWTARDSLELADRNHLLVGDGGERWLAEASGPDDAPLTKLTAAEALAPEDLVAVRVAKDGGFVFLGR